MKARQLLNLLLLLTALNAGLSVSLWAQPALVISYIGTSWPTVEIQFKVQCNGLPVPGITKNQIHLTEDGVAVRDFSLWCPDTVTVYPISASIVLDASGSMTGESNAGSIAAAHAFIDELSMPEDEAAILWFNASVHVDQTMTAAKDSLHASADRLPAAGMTAVWDGIYIGIQELLYRGVNPARGVIALSDGGDNSSSHTPDGIIALAKKNNVPVYTIGLGSVTPAQLQTIADETGGKYYRVDDPALLDSVFQEVARHLRDTPAKFMPCTISYQSDCMDGRVRDVMLLVDGMCGGQAASEITQYTAPVDNGSQTALEIVVGNASQRSGSVIVLPLRMTTPVSIDDKIAPADFKVKFNPLLFTFVELATPSGSVWEQSTWSAETIPGAVRIRTTQHVEAKSQLLANLVLRSERLNDTVMTPVSVEEWVFDGGCFRASTTFGSVALYPYKAPRIIASPGGILCRGEYSILNLDQEFPHYRWNTGDSAKTLVVSEPGAYFCTVWDDQDTLRSDTVNVIIIGKSPNPVVSGKQAVCPGAIANYTAMFDGAMEVSWRVSNGTILQEDSANIVVEWGSGANGSVVLQYGNVRCRDSVVLAVDILYAPGFWEYVKEDTLCEGDTAHITIDGDFVSCIWNTGDTTRNIIATASGSYTATVTHANGCTFAGSVGLMFFPRPPVPDIIQNGNTLTCSVEGMRYKWYRNGILISFDTSRTLQISEPGQYQVAVANTSGCESISVPALYTGIGNFAPGLARAFDVSPNPANGKFQVALEFERPTAFDLRIVTIDGKEVYRSAVNTPETSYSETVHLDRITPGVNFIVLESNTQFDYRKVLIQPH